MDRCGTLLLRDVVAEDRDTLTIYKEEALKNREINMSDCPAIVLQLLETGKLDTASLNCDERRELQAFLNGSASDEGDARCKKAKRRETRFERINGLMKRFPGGKLTAVSVDTDNQFYYNDRRFEIDSSLKGYAPRHTRYGDQYDMDRVMVMDCGNGSLHFADQDGYDIEDEMITSIGR